MNFRYFIKLIFNLFIKIYQDKKSILIFVFCFSLIASLFFLFFLKNVGPEEHKFPGSDYLLFYNPVAEGIKNGEGILPEIGTRYPIGYPLILSVLFSISGLLGIEKLVVIVIFNVLITALATSFFFLFVKSILNKKIALIASFLWMSYPFNLWFIKNPNTEIPFNLFLYLALWIYVLGVKKRSFKLFLISGGLIGFATLLRPTSVFLTLPLAFLIFLLTKKSFFWKKILFSSALIVAYIIVILPWTTYVYLSAGKMFPISTSGPSSVSYGIITIVDKDKDKSTLIILPEDVVNLVNRYRAVEMGSVINISIFFLEELKNQPIAFLKLIAIKMARSWYATSEMWWEKEILLVQLFYLIPGVIGAVLWFKRFKQKIPYLIFLVMVIFYFWTATIVAASILRYMVPMMAIFMIFFAITINEILNKLIKNEAFNNYSLSE